jgi:GNAT superfamily N-acetyltransferase
MPARDVQVRPAGPDDAAAVAGLVRRSKAAAMPWLPVLHTPDEDLVYFGHAVGGGPDHAAWVAEVDGEVVGVAAAGHGGLEHLYVDPDHQGRGIGTRLFRAAAAHLPPGFGWWVFADNQAAQRFYESLGGVPVYATDGSGNEERCPDLWYRWLPPGQ